ncbi:zinc-binding dehydrogenase [bacterium]|nr:zinc-binding dehydrogenase [bacterium]
MYKKINRTNTSELEIISKSISQKEGLLVKTLYASICFWADWNYYKGLSESVGDIGHECVVEVMEDWKEYKKGQRLAYYYHEGAFSEVQMIFPDEIAVTRLSSELPLRQGVFAEPLFAVIRMLDGLELDKHEKVFIAGGGPIGIILNLLLNRLYPEKDVFLLEINKKRQEILKKRGFTIVGYDEIEDVGLFIDCFGNNFHDTPVENYLKIFNSIRNGGTYVVFGHSTKSVLVPFSTISKRNITIRGIDTDMDRIRNLVPMVTELIHTMDLSWMITEEISFNEIPEWFSKIDPDSRKSFKTGIIFE